MALPDGFGLKTRFTQKEFLAGLDQFAQQLRTAIEAGVEGFATDAAASAERRARVMGGDFEFFCRTYAPHYVKGEPSEMHEHVFKRLPQILDIPTSVYEWLMAPRGEAKSTIVTQLFTLFCVVTGKKHFIPIIMATGDLAIMMIEAIKAELEINPRLQMDFPEACGKGRVWQATVAITANDVKLMAVGAGKKLRGMRHGPYRPDLVILDDMENDENVRSPEQRKKLLDWILRAVIPLGPPGGKMDVIYVGTLLHYAAVLAKFAENAMTTGRKFKSIKRYPDRMDLWDRYEEILRNDSVEAADAFYARQKDVMDAGAEVSWPSVRPIAYLMKQRILLGRDAFNSEQQNEPIDADNATFGNLKYWTHVVNAWLYFGAVDPSMGTGSARSDPSAILVGGFNKDTGVLNVVEASIRKRVPDLIIEDVIKYHQQYKCRAWGVEAVQFQAFFATEIVKRSAARNIPVPVVAIKSTTDKALRIESIQPHVANSLILFHPKLVTLIEQLEHWPSADHDDGPDCLEMLWTLVQRRLGGMGIQAVGGAQPVSDTLRDYGVGRGGGGFIMPGGW